MSSSLSGENDVDSYKFWEFIQSFVRKIIFADWIDNPIH